MHRRVVPVHRYERFVAPLVHSARSTAGGRAVVRKGVPGDADDVSITMDLDGTVSWWLDGRLHREGGPAVHGPYGEEWRVHGVLHRLDGPALDLADDTFEWRRDGRLHRVGGPAVKRLDGGLEWWENGRPHRVDGPAFIHPLTATEAWFVDGVQTVRS